MNENDLLTILKNSLNIFRTKLKDKLDQHFKGKSLTKLDLLSMGLLAKSSKTVDAIICLVNNGFGEDAAILARTIYENLINIRYIYEQDSEKRAELYMGNGYLDFCSELGEIKAEGEDKKTVEILLANINNEELSNIRKARDIEKKRLQNSKGFNTYSWSFLSIKQMSNSVQLGLHHDRMYKKLSQIVHANASSLTNYVQITNLKIKFNDLPTHNLKRDALVVSSGHYLLFLDLINEKFKLELSAEINEIIERLRMILETSMVTDSIKTHNDLPTKNDNPLENSDKS